MDRKYYICPWFSLAGSAYGHEPLTYNKEAFCFILSSEIAKNSEKDGQSKTLHVCAVSHPAQRGGDISAWRGVDCLFLLRRLAMPR